MIPESQIIDAKPYHCGAMSRLLRYEHQRQLILMGLSVHAGLRATFDASYYRKAWMVDGRLSALWGIIGSTLGTEGLVWLAIAERATRYPLSIVKLARQQLEEISTLKAELFTTVISDDPAALRLAVFLGFRAADGGMGGAVSSRLGRRTMLTYVRDEPGLRVPTGTGYQIGMIWNAGENRAS